MREWLASGMLVLGALFTLLAALGILRLPDTVNAKYPDRPRCYVVSLDPARRFNPSDFDWLLPADRADRLTPTNPAGWAEELLAGVDGPDTRPPGLIGRNQGAAKLAGRYIGAGLSPAETLTLLEGWNRRNRPPLPDAELAGVVQSMPSF